MPSPTEIEALEQFVSDNDDLLALEARLGRFNVFDALGVANAEIRHSNFLAFLLDPNESHGLGQLFLSAFLMDVLKSAPRHLRPFSLILLDGADLGGVMVRREEQRIDLLITSEQPSFVIAIENKVGTSEHSNQLERYERMVDAQHPSVPALFVYLTVTGEEASRPRWVSYTYADLWRTFDRARQAYSTSIGGEVRVFLDHYLSLIGNRFMDDPQLDELCQRIWRNHRQALRLIWERAGSPGAGVIGEVERIVRDDPRWHVFYRSGGSVDFIPKEWTAWLPEIGTDVKSARQSWFVMRFELYQASLTHYVEVRQMQDAELRKSIVQRLMEKGPDFGFKKPNTEGKGEKYTRVSGKKQVLKWTDDAEPESAELERAVKERLDQIVPFIGPLAAELRQLTGVSET